MKKLAVASLFIIMFITGCGTSSNDSQNGISITATQSIAWEGSGDYIEFVIDIGSPNETGGNIIVYFDASGTALDRNDIEGNTDLLNGYVEIPSQSHHHKAIRVGGFTKDGIVTETQTITLRITGCSSAEYPIGPESEATAVVMDSDGPTVIDIDGNEYPTVLIGTQVWMQKNMNYETGNSWCYDDNPENCQTYGRLYDWATSSEVCPPGWHLPSDYEWEKLVDFFGNYEVAGGKMKETGTSHWRYPNTGATNSSGFTALPGGYRTIVDGYYEDMTEYAYFWSSSQSGATNAWFRILDYYTEYMFRSNYLYKQHGFSCRCLKD